VVLSCSGECWCDDGTLRRVVAPGAVAAAVASALQCTGGETTSSSQRVVAYGVPDHAALLTPRQRTKEARRGQLANI
jgi:hypothetical protein